MEPANQPARSYYLDSNAWINLGNIPLLYKSLLDKYESGQIYIITSTQVLDELVTKPGLKPTQAESNRMLLIPFLSQKAEDRLFVLGLGLLDGAILGGDCANDLHKAYVNEKQGTNDFRDGIHLVNAVEVGAVLVTCDRKLRLSAQRLGCQYLCLGEFAAECNLDTFYNCTGCK